MDSLIHVSPWDCEDKVVLPRDLSEIPGTVRHAQSLVSRAAEASEQDRADTVLRFLQALDTRAGELARAVERDTGRLPESCSREVEGTIRAMRMLAGAWLFRSRETWGWAQGVVQGVDRPLGLALLITPGNFPFSAALRKTVAAVLAGCVAVVKTSERAPRTTLLLRDLVSQVDGLPAVVVGGGREEAVELMNSGAFSAVSFTGSTASGRRIAASIDRSSVELQVEAGGKNFCLIDEDVPLRSVLPGVLRDAWDDAGQNCVATSRLVVVSRSQAEVVDVIQDAADREAAQSGPYLFGGLMSREAVANAEAAVSEASADGTRVTRHGSFKLPSAADPQAFLVPAIAWNADPAARVWSEDLFAPVLCVTVVPTFEEALVAAADSPYALAGSVYSGTASHIQRATRDLIVGKLVVNAPTRAGAPHVPMAGFGDSGSGPPENGLSGIRFFTRQQVVYELTKGGQ